jgi:hypothetical protein
MRMLSANQVCFRSTECGLCFGVERTVVWYSVKSFLSSNKFPTVYGAQRFIALFVRGHNWVLSWVRSVQSTFQQFLTSLRSILELSPQLHMGLPSWLFFSHFYDYNFISFCHSNIMWWSVQILKLFVMWYLHPSGTSPLRNVSTFFCTLFSSTLVCDLRSGWEAKFQNNGYHIDLFLDGEHEDKHFLK